MQIQITLDGSEKAEAVAKLTTALEGMYGVSRPMATLCSTEPTSAKHHIDLEVALGTKGALAEIEALKKAVEDAKLPESVGEKLSVEVRESVPQFGQQPVPDENTGVHFTGHSMLDRPLELSGAPSGAGAEPLATAPEAPQVIVPEPPSAAPNAPSPPSAAATPPPAGNVKLDKAGLPWDERIHAGSRAMVADGTWRKKRGVAEELVAEVEAKLRTNPAPAAAPAAPNPLDNLKPEASDAPPPPAGTGLTFRQVTSRVTVALANKTLTGPDLIRQLHGLGVENLAALDGRPDLWAAAIAKLGV